MEYIFYTFFAITSILILGFLALWTYIRWQKIAKKNRQDWYTKAFMISGSLVVFGILLTMIFYYTK